MKTQAVMGVPTIDAALVRVPELLTAVPSYEQHVGYKSWKVRALQRTNWLQWNDGDVRLRISFPNESGARRTWKLFARFGAAPLSRLWDRPIKYERKMAQWMPAGRDVWGCSYEELSASIDRLPELVSALARDLELSYRYAIAAYES